MYPYPFNQGLISNFPYSDYNYYSRNIYSSSMVYTSSQVELINLMRLLWEQHGAWTRTVTTSIVFDLPNADAVTNRLLRNPVDFEQALKPFYGDRIAAQFRDLLRAHLVIAAELVKAAKAGDTKTAADAEKRWYANADEIAALLGSINPYWTQEGWKVMLHSHLELVKAQAVNMLAKKFEADIRAYDENERQTLQMADMLASGIARQFPQAFTR